MGKNQWVVRHGDGWGIRGEGNDRLTRVFEYQAQAIDAARDIARHQQAELLIQNRHGQVRERESYGRDPMPPRDER